MRMSQLLRSMKQYPAAVVGLVIIAALLLVGVYAVIAIPHSEAVRLWRGGGDVWQYSPITAWPKWVNLLPWENRSTTMILCSTEIGEKTVRPLAEGMSEFEILVPFDFPYDGFPQEVTLFFDAEYDEVPPHAVITWLTPDGRVLDVSERAANRDFRLSVDHELTRKLGGIPAQIGLFADPADEGLSLKGEYTLRITGWFFDDNSALDARLVVFGQVHGLAGTDHMRRCLMVALLWGIPVALVFGAVAAIGSGWTTFALAAIGVWYSRWVDGIFSWIVQVNMVLPMLPILIMVGMFFSRSIFVIVGVIILFSIFSAGYFSTRAIFLQIKESGYIEAANAYGASNLRIIFRYLIPKVVPVLVPSFVMAIPGFVFLEASLALLGLGDPHLPTLGKLVHDAHVNGAIFNGHYYWLLMPGAVLMLMGFAFCMVGYTLDRIVNPRLRQI